MLQIFQEASRYNSGSHSSTVESLSEAIQILGSERFLKMLKRLVKRSHTIPEGQKKLLDEAVNEAFVSGVMAEKLAQEAGLENSQAYFLSGQLHQFARVLVSKTMPFEFEKRSALAGKVGRIEAEKRTFGMTLTELSLEMLKDQPIPVRVKDSIFASCELENRGYISADSDGGASIYAMARKTLQLLSAANLDQNKLEEGVAKLIPIMSREIPFTREDFFSFLRKSSDAIQSFNESRGVSSPAKEYPLLQRLDMIAHEEKGKFPNMIRSEVLPIFRIDSSPTSCPDDENVDSTAYSHPSRSSGFALAQNIFSDYEQFSNMDTPTMAEFLAWTHLKIFHLHNCLVFMPNEHLEEFSLIHAEGSWFVESIPNVVIDLSVTSIFTPSLRTGKDILLSDSDTERFRKYIPLWLRPTSCDQTLAILPVTCSRGTLALLVCLGKELHSFASHVELLIESHSFRKLVADTWDVSQQIALPFKFSLKPSKSTACIL